MPRRPDPIHDPIRRWRSGGIPGARGAGMAALLAGLMTGGVAGATPSPATPPPAAPPPATATPLDAAASDAPSTMPAEGTVPPTDAAGGAAARPAIKSNRWQEDWSALANPAVPREPLDDLKYIPLDPGDAATYLSLGANLRERYEDNSAANFGIGGWRDDSYVIQRLQMNADLRVAGTWQVFTQLEDARAFDKAVMTPVDANPLDLRQAFAAYSGPVGDLPGQVKIKIGRQEMGFDLQRFVANRDGPNVRQAYDAVWADYEVADWRLISFWSQPVQYRADSPFDDYSNPHLQYGGVRVELRDVGPGQLSVYYSRYQNDGANWLDARGAERRDILDARYAGRTAGAGTDRIDWDVEAMGQHGTVGAKRVVAWALGAVGGYTLENVIWQPRLGLQADAASGDHRRGDGTLGTFNPLFPNGYYFSLAGYTGYTNLIHLKPSLTLAPAADLSLLLAVGLQWRQSVQDAIYVQPANALPGTAGVGHRWTGAYGQFRLARTLTAHLSTALEAVHYDAGQTIIRAGGHDSDYLGIELKMGW